MSPKIHIDSRVGNCCGSVVQPSGATSRQRGSTHRPSHKLTPNKQQVLSKYDRFQRAVQPPGCQDGAFLSDGTMITVEQQLPLASISSPSSCLKRSLWQIHTLLQPEGGWGYQALSLSLQTGTSSY